MTAEATADVPALSIVIPSYNSAPWLPSTIAALGAAVENASLTAELIVVDDGSRDDTGRVVESAASRFPGAVRVITQENAGRFAARRRGIETAHAETILLIDSRVVIGPDSLRVLWTRATSDGPRSWNGHIVTDTSAPLVGLFWEVPTHIFWSAYLADPRPMILTAENFDTAPKGTTMFLAPRETLLAAFHSAQPTVASPLVSDDTKVLRWIAENGGIRLDPAFEAVYRPRTTVRGFLGHAFDRGTLFVDSYAGTTRSRSAILLLLAAAPPALLCIATAFVASGRWRSLSALVGTAAAGLGTLAGLASVRRCPPRSIRAFLLYALPFALPFWAGIARGVAIHRAAFLSTSHKEQTS
ncbi:glycosyltransferase family 2 protein [Microbacterium proteolyticum]|uniref:glycosyltransferase family 2 protein n=1 Tax=Microbacterium proteolyticum TaxID=1572644 RepID=UPI001FACD56E|nr:glycosyltransferase family 2 protein [Microbacterium proteolyticum]MCI9857705.1 glycosyltransferase family 2 protein [Microbacterium proteolyticum]